MRRRNRSPVRSRSDYDSAIHRCKVEARKTLAKIRRLEGEEEHAKAKALERQLLRSWPLRLWAAHRAQIALLDLARKAARRTGNDWEQNLDWREVIRVAEDTKLWAECQETIGLRAETKPKGGFRRIYQFGMEYRARHQMILLVLRNRVQLHPGQMAPVRGLRVAQRQIAHELESDDLKWVAVTDVVDCYSNINPAALSDVLRLPDQVIESNVDLKHKQIDPAQLRKMKRKEGLYETFRNNTDEEEAERISYVRELPLTISMLHGRLGIPTGASCSPIIAEAVIAKILEGAPTDVRIYTWVDDIIILGKTKIAVQRAFESLRDAFASAQSGPFWLKTPRIRRVADPFEFIGYGFQRRKGRVTVKPSYKNFKRLEYEVASWLHEIQWNGQGETELRLFMKGWTNVFADWSEIGKIQRRVEYKIGLARMTHRNIVSRPNGRTPEEVSRSLKVLRWYFPAPKTPKNPAASVLDGGSARREFEEYDVARRQYINRSRVVEPA